MSNWENEEFDLEDEYSEEELDAMYAPKKRNSRKTMVPVHVYKTLVAMTSPSKHLSQAELISILEKDYELKIERKALGRYIHNLEDEGLGIKSSPKNGVWYDESKEWRCTNY